MIFTRGFILLNRKTSSYTFCMVYLEYITHGYTNLLKEKHKFRALSAAKDNTYAARSQLQVVLDT